jgi:uncharacterized membrane protein
MAELLSVLVLLGSGTTMGVFFAVAVSVAPAMFAMAPDRYVEAHQLLGKGYHPAMPVITSATLFAGVALAAVAPQPAARVLFGLGAVGVLGIQAVSHLGNVPINRSLAAFGEGTLDTWPDPRPKWRFWHRIRTVLAVAAFVANSLAATLGG